ncbi:hypothetical protein [Streptomyces sp. NRRL S-350]|uniref:hypothetical protein n=1 Tax=Streptomyces sp. NRRL S-350 TaxID=1463902 RepID=UPI0004C05177|nr:hypothetical protein [Streptomyces sp. NRRL S-350]
MAGNLEHLLLNHANIDEAADALTASGSSMHDAMENLRAALQSAENQLQGQLATAASDFRKMLDLQESEMTNDITAAANTLRTMHGLLRDADANAAAGVG